VSFSVNLRQKHSSKEIQANTRRWPNYTRQKNPHNPNHQFFLDQKSYNLSGKNLNQKSVDNFLN